MEYVNAGVYVNGARPKTKKQLREALAADPASVVFDPTDVFGPAAPIAAADEIPEHVSVSVCGPDPYTQRRWYSQVTLTPDGPRAS